MSGVRRGRLADASKAPSSGERVEELAHLTNVTVTQILSGQLPSPVDYCQDDDEIAIVLAGAAVVEVEGARLNLGPGDWVLLPARVHHRLVETAPGTNWLTVHVHPPPG